MVKNTKRAKQKENSGASSDNDSYYSNHLFAIEKVATSAPKSRDVSVIVNALTAELVQVKNRRSTVSGMEQKRVRKTPKLRDFTLATFDEV